MLRSFIASLQAVRHRAVAWFRYVLSRIPAHSITRLSELLPHNWKPTTSSGPSLGNLPILHPGIPAVVYETLTHKRPSSLDVISLDLL